MQSEKVIVQTVIGKLDAVAAEPASHDVQFEFFQYLSLLLNSAVLPELLGRWFDICGPTGTRAQTIDQISENLHGHEKQKPFMKYMSVPMMAAGLGDEAVHAFSHGCWRFDEGEPSPTLVEDDVTEKFRADAPGYDGRDFERKTAGQFISYAADRVPIRSDMAALEVGCGTGLIGTWLKPKVASLDGIDLSPHMVEQAEAKGIYTSLAVGEGSHEMGKPARRDRYDLIICHWVLFYMPDLRDFFHSAASAMAPGGRLAISAYPCLDDTDVKRKETELEYAHSYAYLRRLAMDNGFVEDGVEVRQLCTFPGFYASFELDRGARE